MAHTDDIRSLRARALNDLAAAHDYFTDTKLAWRIVRESVKAGYQLNQQSPVTNTITTEADLVARSHDYVTGPLIEATFQQFIAIFENFFFDLLRLWLLAYPRSLEAKQVPFKAVLDAPDKDAVALLVVNRELNELMYERPKEWFKYLEAKAKLGCPTDDDIDRFAEAKASRDVLAHNRGVVNKTYEAKAGRLARHRDGQKLDVPEPYHRQVWDMLLRVVAEVGGAAAGKLTV